MRETQNSAWIGNAFETGGDVHAVAVEIALVVNQVTEVDADPEPNPLHFRQASFALGHAPLDARRALDRIDGTAELADRPVAGKLDDTAMVLGKERHDEFRAMIPQARHDPTLVALHQARVTRHVRHKDGSKPAIGAGSGHGVASLKGVTQRVYQLVPIFTRCSHLPTGTVTPLPCPQGCWPGFFREQWLESTIQQLAISMSSHRKYEVFASSVDPASGLLAEKVSGLAWIGMAVLVANLIVGIAENMPPWPERLVVVVAAPVAIGPVRLIAITTRKERAVVAIAKRARPRRGTYGAEVVRSIVAVGDAANEQVYQDERAESTYHHKSPQERPDGAPGLRTAQLWDRLQRSTGYSCGGVYILDAGQAFQIRKPTNPAPLITSKPR